MTQPTETLVVRFENDHHKNLHQVLLDAGFIFQVTGDLQIGRHYANPKKSIEVTLEDGDEEAPWLECKVSVRGHILTDKDYSKVEWDWMTAGPDTADNAIEMLRRELHILINIRPHYMTGAQIAQITAD